MAEKLIFSTSSSIHSSKKRKISESDDVHFLTHDVDKVYLSDIEPLSQFESTLLTTSGQPKDSQELYFNDPEILMELDISKVNQYVRMLAEESRIYQLEDSEFATVADFDIQDGRVVLSKKTVVVINVISGTCTCCNSNSCLHFQAFDECSKNNCMLVCESKILDGAVYFNPNPHNIILIVDRTIHNFCSRSGSWNCDSCLAKCKERIRLPHILSKIGESSSTETMFTEIEYKTISTLSIPLILDEILISTYNTQLYQGTWLPSKSIFPENSCCEYGYKFNTEDNLKLEKTGIIIYTENDIIELDEHKVYSSTCNGPCECLAVFEGRNDLLLNINNRYFVHYSLLFDYSELMTMSRNTLYGYLSAKNRKLKRMGRKGIFKYHIVQHAWNAYLRMVDINYSSHYTCPQCKHKPDTIILDGIAMGTMKELPSVVPSVDHDQIYPLIPLSERLFTPSSTIRNKLSSFCSQGLTEDIYDELMVSLNNQAFTDYILFSSYRSQNHVELNPEYGNVKKIIQLLSRNEPITGIFQFSILDNDERTTVALLSNGKSTSEEDLVRIYQKMHNLEILFTSINPETKAGFFTLNSTVALLLKCILTKIENLFKSPSRKLVEFSTKTDDFYNYFPAFDTNYKLPLYGNDDETAEGCSKVFPKHYKFSPGLIAISCKHRVCYGFQILRKHESTVLIYDLLLTIFKVQPKVIIYDNACNLHKTCMKRDPRVFRNTTFLVDRFHSTNHKCNPSYSMRNIHTEEIKRINSQVSEQLFSILRRIATQIAYMRVENIFFTIRYFLACVNQDNIIKANAV